MPSRGGREDEKTKPWRRDGGLANYQMILEYDT
jgi:hypothetical protein